MLLRLVSTVPAFVGFTYAACGDSSLSDDGKTQSVEPCTDNSTSNANITLASGVVKLNLTGSVLLGSLNCSDNDALTTITAPNLTSISDITLHNLPHLSIIDMPELASVSNITLTGIGNSTTPDVPQIQQRLLLSNSSFETFTTGSKQLMNIEVAGNSELQSLSFPQLRQLGAIHIDDNSQLHDLSASFPSLQLVGGAITISGNITSIAFPKLKDVQGGLEVVGSTALDCDGLLDSLKKQGVSSEMLRCDKDPKYSSTSSGPTASPSSTTGGSSSESGPGSRRKIGLGVGIGVGVPLVAAAVFLATWLLRKRRSKAISNDSGADWEKSNHPSEGVLPMANPKLDEPGTGAPEANPRAQVLHIENRPLSELIGSQVQVQRSGSKFREHGLRPDGGEI